VAVAAVLGACGDKPVDEGPAQTVTTAAPATTTTVPRNYSADLTTTDGYRYKITLLLGAPTARGAADECPGEAAPGKVFLPVTLTVANAATDRPAPFPPVRVEMTAAAAAGARPAQVQVRDTSGACTFAPRVPSIPAAASVTFKGTSPAVDAAAAPGSAGRLEVKVSESTFSLVAPLP
jgi:hypothetical protein